jgi:hypothetical protein
VIVDVGFRARGEKIPADHGYLLYGAVTSALPQLHAGGAAYAIHPVRGRQLPGRELAQQRPSSAPQAGDRARAG